ncbi:SDR family oxidoreductase [Burkholderia multivorans]|uniref:SDR family oxidoreductase n=1 Tax=Burkholderia multivorans TaxID=87883 RepID=UPI0004F78AA6|nr:SDR family oxidoreductase [Burkholderia multivorans]AIO75711.1 NAD dependent epimerase/dehydratase family protein [Burkholderia multivorans]AOK67262.1 NAD-dependent dehydratase [Burkholderia multivorans]KVZ73940.1 NAD-dependent dehydratase [Burkholderia multivorans]
MNHRALIVGASGIVGRALAERLLSTGWTVYGLSRGRTASVPGCQPVVADLTSAESVAAATQNIEVSHVFFTAWARQATEKENIRVNGAMVRNVLDSLGRRTKLEHAALVTGLKHYLGPFEAYASGAVPDTPFRESQGRQPVENFYYEQEDRLFEAAARDGFTWSVHRPHTVIGFARGNAMNMGQTLAVYATLCRHTGQPFVFPGSAAQWNGLTDMTDARLLARHLEWASTTDAGRNEDFNVVNGDVFRWKTMWGQLADYFGIEAAPFDGIVRPLEGRMQDAAHQWRDVAAKYDLTEPDIDRLASWWHTDADLGRPMEVVTDMTKSRKAGFLDYQGTPDAFFDLFERLKAERLIPE